MTESATSRAEIGELKSRLADGDRLDLEEWTRLAGRSPAGAHLVSTEELRRLADRARARLHPDGVVTYIVDRNINYSNVCTCVCTFCIFYRKPGDREGYVLTHEEIARKVEETLELGGSGILMQGGLHPDLPLEWYTDLLSMLKERYRIHLHCFSPPEVLGLSNVTGKSYREVLEALRRAGLDSIPGGGGEILVDEIRRRRRSECTAGEWLEIMETAHDLGIPTTATMMIGIGETDRMRLEHLEKIRAVQDRSLGRAASFVAFIPWTFQPDDTPLGKIIPDRLPVEEYLRWLAIARLYLDNIANIQVSWLTQGIEGGKAGLHGGANDIGSTMIEENVISPAGARFSADEALLRRAIVEAGFRPAVRNAVYRRLEEPRAPLPV